MSAAAYGSQLLGSLAFEQLQVSPCQRWPLDRIMASKRKPLGFMEP